MVGSPAAEAADRSTESGVLNTAPKAELNVLLTGVLGGNMMLEVEVVAAVSMASLAGMGSAMTTAAASLPITLLSANAQRTMLYT